MSAGEESQRREEVASTTVLWTVDYGLWTRQPVGLSNQLCRKKDQGEKCLYEPNE